MGGLGKASQRGGTGGSKWPCAVNRSGALAVLGLEGEDKRQVGSSRRFRVRLGVGVAAQEDKWDGRSDRVGCWQASVGGRGGATGRRKIEFFGGERGPHWCARTLCV